MSSLLLAPSQGCVKRNSARSDSCHIHTVLRPWMIPSDLEFAAIEYAELPVKHCILHQMNHGQTATRPPAIAPLKPLSINGFARDPYLEARVVIGDFKDDHNHRHRHSALGYQTPDEAQESSPGVLTEIPHPWAGSTVAIFG